MWTGNGGSFDLVLDPNFGTNGFLYVFYTANAPLRDTVSRFTASGNAAVPGSEVVIWQDTVAAGQFHHGGALEFGPDGRLYIATGDHFSASDAQSLTSYHGKILRLNADGSIPTDNPFFDGAGPNLDAIWALGLRNPYNISWDQPSGRLFIGDVGEASIEEVNLGAAGANYGWPICEGNCSQTGMTNPIFSYPHAGRDAAVTGGFVYRGTQFPASYMGSYFYGDYVRNWIRRLTLDGSGNVNGDGAFWPEDGSLDGPWGDIVDMVQGPEGALYYTDVGISWEGQFRQGTIRRISFVSANQPPTIMQASASPQSGLPPLTVTFSATATDPENNPLTFLWVFGDGVTSNQPNTAHTYAAAGPYTARLTVSDGTNQNFSSPFFITVGNPPTATIQAPLNGATFRAGDVIPYSGSATDPDEVLTAANFSWTILFHHDTHVHPAGGPFTGTTSGTLTIAPTGHSYQGNTRYEIVLTVTDSTGLQNTVSVFVFPEKVNLSLDTNPSGLTLQIDGISRPTPFVLDTLINFQHSISAPNQTLGGTQYQFSSWSDGGTQTHTITVPAVNQSYTATYQAVPPPAPSDFGVAYGFEEGTGTTTADASASGNTANLFGPTWVIGRYGNGLSFDGVDDRARAALSFTLGPAFSLLAWVNNPSNSAFESILTVGSSRNFYLSNGTLAFYNGTTDLLFGSALPNSGWQHVALVYDGSTLQAYLNGTPVGAPQTVTLGAVTGALQIGAWINNANNNTDFFNGLLDEVRIYNRALSQTEIQNAMNAAVLP